jgi:hypothetical protein
VSREFLLDASALIALIQRRDEPPGAIAIPGQRRSCDNTYRDGDDQF